MPEQAWTPVDEPSGWTPVAEAKQPQSLGEKFDDLSQGAGDAGAHMMVGAYEMFRKAAKAIGFDKLPEPSEALKKAGETPESSSAWRKWGRRIEEIAPYFATGSSMLGSAAVAGAQTGGDLTAMGGAAAGAGALKALPAVAKVVANPEVQKAIGSVVAEIPGGKVALRLMNALRDAIPGGAKAVITEAPRPRIVPGEAPPPQRPSWRDALVEEANQAGPEPSAAASPAAPNEPSPATPTVEPAKPGPQLVAPPKGGANPHQELAQQKRANVLARFLHMNGEGIAHSDALRMGPDQWKIAWEGAKAVGGEGIDFGRPPSLTTQRLALKMLEDWQGTQ